jgi:DNA-binding MarR family transcriptional regulator
VSEPGRDENLLGALALAVADRLGAEVEEAAEHGAAAPAALVAVASWLRGGSVDQLRAVVGLSHSGAVRLVDRLQAAGLVERHAASDGRAVALVPTPTGEAVAARVAARRRAAMGDLLAALSEQERSLLTPLLERLLAGVVAAGAAPGRICRLCEVDVCGHPDRCPVTLASRAQTPGASEAPGASPATR